MAQTNSVKIVEAIQVTPSSNLPKSANEFTLPLTFFDILWFKFAPVDCLYFFQLTDSTSTPSYFYSEMLPKLNQSLSLTLNDYFPLTGYLKWPSDSPKPLISYTPNNGISLTVAECNYVENFVSLFSNQMHKAKGLTPLVPELISSEDEAEIMSLQITFFPHQGFCLAARFHHAAIDGKTAIMFIMSWAYLCKNGGNGNDQLDSVYLSRMTTIARNLKVMQKIDSVSDDLVLATFEFRQEDIKNLRHHALSELDKAKQDNIQFHHHYLSTFVLTLAYTVTCLVKTKGDEDRNVIIALSADCRARLDPPIPITYFGNCIMAFESCPEKARNFMDEKAGFGFAVEMVNDLVRQVKNGILKGAEEKFVEAHRENSQIISVAGSPKLNFYGCDFGWGKAKKVEILSIVGSGAVSMTESRDGSGGVEIADV
ncbi:hypothetical protein COLO4_05929 [Corchorus olitorius]|uniref:Transferase n=1 Tax=Corchorus olitorius TaxID=93759 RepID=A0A1R3KPF6_9ROSI|nr:hypothetical protein COLO4_05929 [Corchorus olitorius]